MKAIKLLKNGKIVYVDINDPKIKKGFAKIRVCSAGLCGSDIQKILYDSKARASLKTEILGHEFSGIIEEIYPNTNLKKGERVAIIPLVYDKTLSITNAKSLGKDFDGGFAEYCLVPIANLRRIPEQMSFDLASLADVSAVSIHGWALCGRPTGKKVLIIGDGSIAMSTAILLRYNKNKVTLMGKNRNNIDIAKKLGILTMNKLEKENYFDFVFECVGRSQDNTLTNAIKAIKPLGKIVVLGVFKKEYQNKLLLRNLFFKEASLIGSNSYNVNSRKDDFVEALYLISKNYKEFSKIITHTIPLKNFNKSILLVKNKKERSAIKIIFRP